MKQHLHVGATLLLGLSLAGMVYAEGGTYHTTNGGQTTTHPDDWKHCQHLSVHGHVPLKFYYRGPQSEYPVAT